MSTVAVGTRWDTADVPLPQLRPMPGRGAIGAELVPGGDLVVDPARDPLVATVADRTGEQRWLAAQSARYDERLAQTYLEGAGELASRSGGRTQAERREWGARAMLAELACALRLPETTLARRLTRITMLASFPRLKEAATSGRVSSWHCDVVLDAFAGVTDPDVLARADEFLAGRATRMTAPQLRASATGWRSRHVRRSPEQQAANLADRHVRISPADEDMMWLVALVPAAAAVAIDHRLDEIAERAAGRTGRSATSATRQQLRSDALVGLLLDPDGCEGPVDADADADADARQAATRDGARGTDVGRGSSRPPVPGWVRGIKPEVVIAVPVLSLLGHSDEPAELEGFGPIDLETARQLCAQAPSFLRVLTHPDTGAVLSVGRDRYRIPADLKRAVRLRDGTCRFPGCQRRARRCDVDHSLSWEDGGATELCNLACLCRKHHRLKHEMGWEIAQEPGGVLRWRSALGFEYRTEPDALWPPGPQVPTSQPVAPSPDTPPGGRAPARGSPGTNAGESSSGYPDEPPY
jgi:hypothetical protein